MSDPDRNTGDPYIYMDAMRALLAFAVAFGHVWVLFVQDYRPTDDRLTQILYGLAGFAHPAVVMFFVLSGYWITHSVVRRAERGWSWGGYMADRLGRLAAVLVPALLLGGLLDWAALELLHSPTHLGVTKSWVLRKDVAADLSPATLVGNLLFLEGILVNTFGTNGPLWSVAGEFWFYVWFPALYLLLRRGHPSWMLLSLLLILLAPKLALYFVEWLCGSYLFFLERRMALTRRGGRVALAMTALALLVVLVWGRVAASDAEDLLLALCFMGTLLALMAARPRALPGLRLMARFGARSSFSLYATHFPVIALGAALAVGDRRLAPSPSSMLLVGAVLLTALLVAAGFSAVTEARTDRVRAWLRDKLEPDHSRSRAGHRRTSADDGSPPSRASSPRRREPARSWRESARLR